MKKWILQVFICLFSFSMWGQKKQFNYKFYGQFRSDYIYNSRKSYEGVEGLFYSYPMEIEKDHQGNDINNTSTSGLFIEYSRLGLQIETPELAGFKTQIKLETDFRGNGTTLGLLRIRHAYIQLNKNKSQILVGQTWHPMFSGVIPSMLNLSTGAPFHPFNRSPQISFSYNLKKIDLSINALWQIQYKSTGPIGKSISYIKQSGIPELVFTARYKDKGFNLGTGIGLLSLVPRTETTYNNKLFKVNERVTSLSANIYASYKDIQWYIAAQSMLASNMTHCSMLGGFAVSNIDSYTGEQTYTPYTFHTNWINILYGKTWKAGLFFGFQKNLGTTDVITGEGYGNGLNLDKLTTISPQITYNTSHIRTGIEYAYIYAQYGNINKIDGSIFDTYLTDNHRIVATICYKF